MVRAPGMRTIRQRLEAHGTLFGQLLRYAITGGGAAAINIVVYYVGATFMGVPAVLANFFGYLGAVSFGYIVHSRWSFRDDGRRDDIVRTGGRFVAVSLVSLALNSFWVWLLVVRLGLPTWTPIPLVLGVTPLLIFSLNRRWVFR